MSFLIKYVEYDEALHRLKVTAFRLEKQEEHLFFEVGKSFEKPLWMTEHEYRACSYLYACLGAIRNGNYTLRFGDYFKRNDLESVGFFVESKEIHAQETPLEYVFVNKRFGAVRFREVPSLMVNVPYFNLLETAFLHTSPHRLRLLI